MNRHQFFTKRRLHRANQERLGGPCGPAHRIDAKMKTVDQVNVSVPRMTEHHAIPLRQSRRSVTGWIADQVSFRFHNRATTRTVGRVANEEMSQQIGRDNFRRRLIKRSWQWRKTLYLHRGEFSGGTVNVQLQGRKRPGWNSEI